MKRVQYFHWCSAIQRHNPWRALPNRPSEKLVPAIGRIVSLSEAISAVVELQRTGLPKEKLVIVPA